jgi:membrane protein
VPSAGLRRFWKRAKVTLVRAGVEMVDDRGHRDAAQIAFFGILSFVPLAMLLVWSFGLVFDDQEVRERVIDAVFENVPLSQEADERRLKRSVGDALDNAGELGPFSILLLLAAASGVMGALRHSINVAWDIEERPPLLKRKALDLALVFGGTVLLLFSLSQAGTREAADTAEDSDNGGGGVASALLDALGDLLPFLFTAAVILFLYRILPFPRPKVRDIWPGAVVAAALIELVRGALDFYFEHLANLGALYGSLGALMALLLFVYGCSLVVVFGAEVASEWSRVPDQGPPLM